MRRFTRSTNAFSKKVENPAHAVSLRFMYYNFSQPFRELYQFSCSFIFAYVGALSPYYEGM